ncbi:kinase-like domain-containing protein, partial [Blyttiomyces helicus]
QIVAGLCHVHGQNVIHRDLKPENIFLEEDHVYLGDFGLAKSIAEHILSPTSYDFFFAPGTYLYLAPEILNEGVCTTKSDIYSLGVLMFELFYKFDTAMERAVVSL